MAQLHDPVRVARSADDRRLGRRDEGLPRGARARRPGREPARGDLSRRARARRRRDRGGARGARVAGLAGRASRSCSPARRRSRSSSTTSSARRRSRGCCRPCFDALEAAGQAGGRRLRERQGLPDVRVGHRAEDRPREPRPDGAARHPVPPERAAERGRLHVRRRLLARHAGLAAQRGRGVRREDHDRPGAVEPLGRGRRRQADPPGRRLRRDDRVEPLRLRPVAADALRRAMRARCAPTSTRSRRCAASSAR